VAAIRGITNDINDIEDILKMADDALYKAKAQGRNCVVTLEPGIKNNIGEKE
jgi:PleD family two-component response regulator